VHRPEKGDPWCVQWSRHTARLAAGCAAAAGFAGLMVAVSLEQPRAAAKAGSPFEGRVGLNSHLVWLSRADAQPQLERARGGGVEWIREEFPWRVLEPAKGTFDWRKTDQLMAAASSAGVNVLAILTYSAKWASSDPSGGGDEKYPPRDPADYAGYAVEVVKRYGPSGRFWAAHPELTPRPLTAVELWNEPWGHWFWKPNPNPAAYARLVRAAGAAIRRHDPTVRILIAGDVLQVRTDGSIRNWQRELLAADSGLSAFFDAYSVHPYPHPRALGPFDDRPDPRWDFRRVELTHQLDSSKPIWITEIGWSTATAVSDAVSEATQSAFVRGAVERAIGQWGAYVERVFTYQWDRDRGSTADRAGYFGLRRADGTAKPAWDGLVALLASRSTTAPAARMTPPNEPKPPTSGVPSRQLQSIRVRVDYARIGPSRLPRWYWRWEKWRLGTQSARPRGLPRRTPPWAFRRLDRRLSGKFVVILRGSVRARSTRGTSAERVSRATALVWTGEGWRSIRTSTIRAGSFRIPLRLSLNRRVAYVRVALSPTGTSRTLRISAPG
jgi:Beta-galactosidase